MSDDDTTKPTEEAERTILEIREIAGTVGALLAGSPIAKAKIENRIRTMTDAAAAWVADITGITMPNRSNGESAAPDTAPDTAPVTPAAADPVAAGTTGVPLPTTAGSPEEADVKDAFAVVSAAFSLAKRIVDMADPMGIARPHPSTWWALVVQARAILEAAEATASKAAASAPDQSAPTIPAKPRLIAFAGKAGTGKTTAAAHLRRVHGYAGTPITDPMDEMLRPLLARMGVAADEIDRRLKGDMKNDPLPNHPWLTGRRMKQAVGLEFRDAVSRPDAQGNSSRTFFLDMNDADDADVPHRVNESVRYAFEADQIRAQGGIVIMLVDPDDVGADPHGIDAHESERLDFEVDATIENPKTGTAPLFAALDDLVAGRMARGTR
jgi:hypothetical protein